MKGQIDNSIIIIDFKATLSLIDRTSRQKINKEVEDLNNTINQLYLTDICRIFHLPTVEQTFFSSTHGTFSRLDHMKP